MIANVVFVDAVAGGGGGQSGGVSSGDVEVVFSAPFYTGVFLSSRELQGNYDEHQTMVITGMQNDLQPGWNFSSPGSASRSGQDMPMYFIGAENKNATVKAPQGAIFVESIFKSAFEFKSVTVQVKFFEFGFGSIEIRFKGLASLSGSVCSAKEFKDFLSDCEKKIRSVSVMDLIAAEVATAYRDSVPCCIKNSDIWDIDNFAGLESTEGMYGFGEVQDISIVSVLEKNNGFDDYRDELKKSFFHFSENFHEDPYNFTYELFSNEENITIALGRQSSYSELDDLFSVTQMTGVYLAVGKYFNNFFYSYFNYVSSEYEIIVSKSIYRTANFKRLKNLVEKFSDVETLYLQLCLQMQQQSNYKKNLYTARLHTFSPQYLSAGIVWDNLNNSYIKLKDKNDTISRLASQSSFLVSHNLAYTAILLSSFSIIIYSLSETAPSIFSKLILGIYIGIIGLFMFGIYDFNINVEKRKLYYMPKNPKRSYRRQFKNRENYNRTESNFTCGLSTCHRCEENDWHSHIFDR